MNIKALAPASLVSSLTFMQPVLAETDSSVKDEGAGIYSSRVSSTDNLGRMVYAVDTMAQPCFAIFRKVDTKSLAILEIECRKLANRPEWKPIITWVGSPLMDLG